MLHGRLRPLRVVTQALDAVNEADFLPRVRLSARGGIWVLAYPEAMQNHAHGEPPVELSGYLCAGIGLSYRTAKTWPG